MTRYWFRCINERTQFVEVMRNFWEFGNAGELVIDGKNAYLIDASDKAREDEDFEDNFNINSRIFKAWRDIVAKNPSYFTITERLSGGPF